MSETARLSLPYIAPQQAQKQVTYNTAMAALDQLVQPVVKSRTTTSPPGSPAEGDTYIVAPSATGGWAGADGKFAAWLSGAWSFTTPADGWLAYVLDAAELAVHASGAWSSFVTTGGTSLAKLGINTTADLTNRLAVAATSSLFTHVGAGHRLALNKATAADTASLLLEDNLSGRAEIGLTADDALHVKVSPNGSSWVEALNIAQASGLVSLPIGQLAFPATQNPSSSPNVLDDYEEGTWTPVLQFSGASTGIAYGTPTLGRYTKIGRAVFLTAAVTLTSKGSATGSAQISGLPFSTVNDALLNSCTVGFASAMSTVTGAVLMMIQANATRINIYHSNNGAAAALTNSNFGATSSLYFSAAYDTV
ncbi:MAG TPA: DUF2793 domain-containing protein [Devosia sp.]|nr:DUF2793 domain-containing protein [Devosia sp.]